MGHPRHRGTKRVPRGRGATAARLTPDQKVGSSILSALISLLVSAFSSWIPHLSWCLLGSACSLSWTSETPWYQEGTKGAWRNGSASDSRSEGWEFDSLRSHFFARGCFLFI